MGVGSSREHVLVHSIDELVGRIGQVARHLLLDRSALLRPLALRILDVPQACRLGLERHLEIRRRNGGEILSDGLLRVGVVIAAELRVNGGGLIGVHAGAAAKCHVLLCVRHPRKARRRLLAAHQEIQFDRDHRRQSVADDHHAQAVRQRGAQRVRRVRGLSGAGPAGREQQHQERNDSGPALCHSGRHRCGLGLPRSRRASSESRR